MDYLATEGSLTFAAGETSKTMSVIVYGDADSEDDEAFFLLLTAEDGSSVAQATGTIRNDDK